jgi:ATP-dependent helicase HrpB
MGWPDRLARRKTDRDLQLAGGGAARLSGEWNGGDLMVAVDIEHRRDAGAPIVRLASRVRAEWLLDFYPDRVSSVEECVWNRAAERVEARSALLYEGLVIEESRAECPILRRRHGFCRRGT